MEERNKKSASGNNFWSGFSFGIAAGSIGLYLFGTRQGRAILRKTIDVAENLEVSVEELLDELHTDLDSSDALPQETHERRESQHIGDVLDKIRSVLPTTKQVKKYFVKDGKIIK